MFVALTGIVVSFLAYIIAFPYRERRRFDIYLPLFILHLAMAVAYWLFHFESAMDAYTYYRDPYNLFSGSAFESGTYFVVHVVQWMKLFFGGSFLDYFLFFQCFGMIAFALMIRSFTEIADSLGVDVPPLLYAMLFLPGLHFWSVAIGKDAPMFMAISIAVWASIQIQKRFWWLLIALPIMIVIRPHVAAITLIAAGIAFLTARDLSPAVRLALLPVAAVGGVATLMFAGEKFGIDVTDTADVGQFVTYTQGLGDTMGSGADLASLPLPLKVFSLLFRPLFIDASGIMGLAASVENVLLLGLFGMLAWYWRDLFRLFGRVYHVTFCTVFAGALTIALAMVNYNLGLGQRQKMMVMPAVLLIFATVYLYRRYRTMAERQELYAQQAQEAQQAQQAAPAEGTYARPAGV